MPKASPETAKTRVVKRKTAAAPDMDGVVRVNFDINRSDHVKLKIYAAKSGCSMADLLRAFVNSLKMSGIK
jgi:hypothetical protein